MNFRIRNQFKPLFKKFIILDLPMNTFTFFKTYIHSDYMFLI